MVWLSRPEETRMETKPLLIIIALVTLIETLGAQGLGKCLDSPLVIVGMMRLLEGMVIVVTIKLLKKDLVSIGLIKGQWLKGIYRGLIWSVSFGLIALLGFVILKLCGINPLELLRTALPAKTSYLMAFFIIGGLVSPITEELFFRGVLFGYLRQWGFLPALLLSTAAFTGAHISAGIPITQIIGGLVFGWAYEREKNLLIPMIIHITGNMAIFTIAAVMH
jgi:CAAX protease family protein